MEDVLQAVDVGGLAQAATEVASGRRGGNMVGAERVENGLIVAMKSMSSKRVSAEEDASLIR